MVTPSEEQLAVLEKIKEGRNVVIQAVPGAGKTTQILLIFEHCPDLGNVLVLTYNRALKLETKAKIENLSNEVYLESLPDAHTFHSYCQNAYGIPCPNDRGIVKIINENLDPKEDFKYDFLIVDECQDMTGLYFNVVKKIWHPEIRILMVGDPKQSIYGYNGADTRFLTMANRLFQTEFEFMKLSTSYRMTKRITDFLNNCILGQNLIEPSPAKLGPEWPKPKYIIDNPFRYGFREDVFQIIAELIEKGYKRDDMFILAPSVNAKMVDEDRKDHNPIRKLANHLCVSRVFKCHSHYNCRKSGGNSCSNNGFCYCSCPKCCVCEKTRCSHNINIFVPGSDESAITAEDIENKVVFCTFHKAKGLERKVVIILGFDMSYHKYYNKTDPPSECSNPLYVALTRSMDHLILLQTGESFPFVNRKMLGIYAEMKISGEVTQPKKGRPDIKVITPSQIIRHMPDKYVAEISEKILLVKKRDPKHMIKLSSRHKQPDTVEVVCDINGNFVTAMYDYEKDKTRDNYEIFGNIKETTGVDEITEYTKEIISSLLRKTTEWMSKNSGFDFKKEQIRTYNWITTKQLLELKNRIFGTIGKISTTEVPVQTEILTFGKYKVGFVGIIDVVEEDAKKKIIWEVKCVEKILDSHIIQLATYKYINLINGDYVGWQYLLYNVKDDSVYEIIISDDDLRSMMAYLIEKKYGKEVIDDDGIFLSNNILKIFD